MGSCSRGRVGEDTNLDSDRTDDGFIQVSLALFFTIALFTLTVFFIFRRFIDVDILEVNDVYCSKTDLEIPVSNLLQYIGY